MNISEIKKEVENESKSWQEYSHVEIGRMLEDAVLHIYALEEKIRLLTRRAPDSLKVDGIRQPKRNYRKVSLPAKSG